jgi:enoyl-CoA hydratase/carnithine racemase
MTGIRIESAEGILSIVLARPDRKNAINDAMYGAMADAIFAAGADKKIRVLLIRADGDTFTAGNDIADFAKTSREASEAPTAVGRFLREIVQAEKPVIAAVQGNAVGIGTTMLLHCDYVVLDETATLSAPFVSLGLVPEAASSILLPARIGHARAFAMVALGQAVPASVALDWGLANQVVAPAELATVAARIAGRLAKQPPEALVTTKRLLRDVQSLHTRMDVESALFAKQLASPEAKEAFSAFLEKRKPDFSRIG